MDDGKPSDQDIKIVKDESIKEKVVDHALWSSKLSTIIAVIIVMSYALTGLVVLVLAFLQGKEPPVWATVIESSAITGAIAVVFKSYVPGGKAG